MAAGIGYTTILLQILDAGYVLNEKDSEGYTFLHRAVAANQSATVREILRWRYTAMRDLKPERPAGNDSLSSLERSD